MFDSSTGFLLPNGAQRSPDASWVTADRWQALSADDRESFPPLCPDLVIELLSPSDAPAAVRSKMEEYVAAGARLGWLIDPRSGQVEIWRPSGVEALERPQTLSGEDVAPGLSLSLKDIV